MLRKVKLGLRELDASLKAEKARFIISRIKGNPLFPAPDPSLFEIMELVDMMEQKKRELELEREKIQLKTGEVKKVESELDKKLWRLAQYIENSARGRTEIIRSVGLDVRADPKPLGLPGKVIIVSIKETGTPGELKVIWNRVHGARVYNVEISGKTNLRWHLYDATTRTRTNIEHLKSGTQYWFRVQAVGSAGKGEFSEAIARFAP